MYKTASEYLKPGKIPVPFYSEYKGPCILKHTEPVIQTKPVTRQEPVAISQKNNIEMNMIIKKFVNTSDPNIWGPSFWFTIHNGTSKYPEKASPYVIEKMKGFIIGMPVMIPCEKCKVHAFNHIEKHKGNLDQICSTRKNLFNFFVDFHNYVNKRYNKPEMSHNQAWNMYNKGVNVRYMTYA